MITCAVVVCLIFIYATVYVIDHKNLTASLDVQVTPVSSIIKINGNTSSAGNIKVKPGTYKIIVTRNGFGSQSKTVKVAKNKTVYVGIYLLPDSSSTSSWYSTHPGDQRILEAITGNEFDSISSQLSAYTPLLKELPFIGPGLDFRIDYGNESGNKSNIPVIYITAPTAAAQQEGLTWIKSQGYDTSKLIIKYVTESIL